MRFNFNRRDTLAFDPKSYYRFSNDVYPNNTLSSGVGQNADGAINMTVVGIFSSSENWQLYPQGGRWFIRNYDYGGSFQLGLDPKAPSVPKLLPRSGTVGQQWTLSRQNDGTFMFTNGLLGNSSSLGLSKGNTIPGMQPSTQGTHWTIDINVSAKQPVDPDMYVDVENFQVLSSSSSSIASTSTAASTKASAGSGASAASATSSPTTTSTLLPSGSQKSSISGGAIAGIAIGGVVVLLLIGLALFFCLKRRKRTQGKTSELEYTPPTSVQYKQEYYKPPVELAGTPVQEPVEAGDGGGKPVQDVKYQP
ncbi:hypothetical protein BCR34DRAFT_595295 [Clohesyomyces aquaticus]|uniref:Ricin B lectin domain-containing protein n=1 Tax=Clohesyomyces aquaticus TaxID=1231657 RepID=A0A1Y2ABB4_9PLEO|nr:hypothetical protein BCR34DRAFT_595295 [Clohesyomyces aquaticus]